jgi:hypothetical protein
MILSESHTSPIGGYFELELQCKHGHYHNSLRLNSGRSCFAQAILRSNTKKVYLPHFICDSVVEPLKFHGIDYEYYRINDNFEIIETPSLRTEEKLLYVDYFGLKETYVKDLIEKYSSSLIIDNTQNFFARPLAKVDAFYSARKFFGVPDGGYLSPGDGLLGSDAARDSSDLSKCAHLIGRIVDGSQKHYEEYLANEKSLTYDGVKLMSVLSEYILDRIDYNFIISKRRQNFLYIHDALADCNDLHIDVSKIIGPMCYPLLIRKSNLRESLIKHQIFVPQYWKEVLDRDLEITSPEIMFTKHLLPIPIDQRYSYPHMDRIIKIIRQAG